MKNLTYSICYTPASKTNTSQEDAINFICSDHKIHLRFHDFNSEMIIEGFEKKLTYLMTYLMNYSYIPTLIGDYSNKSLIEDFEKTSESLEILSAIRLMQTAKKLSGFKIYENYKKVNSVKPFGDILEECFPIPKVDGILKRGNLEFFLKTFNIDLVSYLFDDAYKIFIHKNSDKDINKKYISKSIRKIDKENKIFQINNLW